MVRNILQSSVQSVYYNVILQVFFRLFTFAINTYLIRTVDKDFLGIINVRLILLESTLIFLSREPINRAALSASTTINTENVEKKKRKYYWAQLINQIWLTVPICMTLAVPCLYIWLKVLTPVQDNIYDQYYFSCVATTISCILQLCAELPSFLCQIYCFVKIKVVFDILLLLSRSVIFVLIILRNHEKSVFAFGVAQILSAFIFLIGYYVYFYLHIKNSKQNLMKKSSEEHENFTEIFPFHTVKEMLPGMLVNHDSTFNSQLQSLTLSFVKQSILKQILTEGEKYVMSLSPVLTFSEQAIYDTVNNLGSLAARFIFRPVEDSSYFYFTQTISRDLELEKQSQEKVSEASRILVALCKTVTSVGLLAFTFAQSYAKCVLLLYGGTKFIADGLAELLLRYHSLAIYFLAINGITEGVMFAINTSADIDHYNYLMGIYSFVFLIFSYGLTIIFGPVGFILANCINMMLRILYSSTFIFKKFGHVKLYPLKGLLPGKIFPLTLLVTGILCKLSETLYFECCIARHILIGAVATAFCLLSWYFENKTLIKILYQKYNQKQHKS